MSDRVKSSEYIEFYKGLVDNFDQSFLTDKDKISICFDLIDTIYGGNNNMKAHVKKLRDDRLDKEETLRLVSVRMRLSVDDIIRIRENETAYQITGILGRKVHVFPVAYDAASKVFSCRFKNGYIINLAGIELRWASSSSTWENIYNG